MQCELRIESWESPGFIDRRHVRAYAIVWFLRPSRLHLEGSMMPPFTPYAAKGHHMTPTSFHILPPRTGDEFERWCLTIFRKHLRARGLTRYRDNGYRQHGIDILGNTDDGAVVAIQCKLRNAKEILSEGDVRGDVELAKSLGVKLDVLTFATSAKQKNLQCLAADITRDHKKQGLFAVEVYSWPDIVDIINEHEDVRHDLLNIPKPLDEDAISEKVVAALKRERVSSREETGSDLILDEIHHARKLTADGYPDLALVSLTRLQARCANGLSADHQLRLHIARGNALYAQGECVQAADAYRRASEQTEKPEKSKELLALTYALLDEKEAAYDLSEVVCELNPASSVAQSVRIRCAPESMAVHQLLDSVPPEVQENAEFLMAVYHRASSDQQYEVALDYARKASLVDPEWVETGFAYGTAMIQLVKSRFSVNLGEKPVLSDPNELDEAKKIFSRIIDETVERDPRRIAGSAFFNRGGINQIAGDHEAAASDFRAAYLRRSDDTQIATAWALALDASGDHGEAIRVLEKACAASPRSRDRALLASLLWERDQGGDRERAVDVLVGGVSDLSDDSRPYRDEYLHALVLYECRLGRFESAESRLSAFNDDVLSPLLKCMLRTLVLWLREEKEDANTQLDACLDLLNPKTPIVEQRRLAMLCQRLERLGQALEIWKKFVPTDRLVMDTKEVLRCAQAVGDSKFALKLSESLRSSGVYDTEIAEMEIGMLLTLREHGRAADALSDYVRNRPDDIRAKVELGMLGIRLGRTDLVDLSPQDLPTVENVDPDTGRGVVLCMAYGGNRTDAAKYAYKLFRLYPDSSDANTALIFSVLGPIDSPLDFEEPIQVRGGTAVQYRDLLAEADHWIVIEDDLMPPPSVSREEYEPDHQVWSRVLQLKPGDTFDLPSTGVGVDRQCVVRAILPKEVYRARHCAENWQKRFPDQPFVESIPWLTSGSSAEQSEGQHRRYDEALKQAKASIDRALEAYGRQEMPIAILAKALDQTVFETTLLLANSPRAVIRYAFGSPVERDRSQLAFRSSTEVVLDPTAIATSHAIGFSKRLKRLPFRCVVSESACEEVRRLAQVVWESGVSSRIVEGELRFVELTDDERVSFKTQLLEFVDVMEASCEVVGGAAFSEIPESLQGRLSKWFPLSTCDAIAIALQRKSAIWVDDRMVANLAHNEFQTSTLWTQGVLADLFKGGHMDADEVSALAVKLVCLGYEFTGISPAIFLSACESSEWDADSTPLRTVVGAFGRFDVPQEEILRLMLGVATVLRRKAPLPQHATNILMAILESLRSRDDARTIAVNVVKFADEAFGLDVLGAAELRSHVQRWLSGNGQ